MTPHFRMNLVNYDMMSSDIPNLLYFHIFLKTSDITEDVQITDLDFAVIFREKLQALVMALKRLGEEFSEEAEPLGLGIY